jgi:hypothetical protein
MLNDPYTATVLIGGGLLACGYVLGKSVGYGKAIRDNMNELFANKLVDPREVLNYYASKGNVKAQQALERLDAERRAKFNAKD